MYDMPQPTTRPAFPARFRNISADDSVLGGSATVDAPANAPSKDLHIAVHYLKKGMDALEAGNYTDLAKTVIAGFQASLMTTPVGDPPTWINATTINYPEDLKVKTTTGTAFLTVPASGLNSVLSTTGANALDNGSPVNDTWYYLYLIQNPITGQVASLYSASATTPILPSNFTVKAPLGIALRYRNNGLQPFVINLKQGQVNWLVPAGGSLAVVETVIPTNYIDINIGSLVPPLAKGVLLCARTTAGTGDNLLLRPKGMTGEFPPCVALLFEHSWLQMPLINDVVLQAKTNFASDTKTIDILGYLF